MPKNIICGSQGQKSNFKAKLEIIGFASRLFENLEELRCQFCRTYVTFLLPGRQGPVVWPLAASRLRAELSAVSGFLGEDAGLFIISLKFLITTTVVKKINSICTT